MRGQAGMCVISVPVQVSNRQLKDNSDIRLAHYYRVCND